MVLINVNWKYIRISDGVESFFCTWNYVKLYAVKNCIPNVFDATMNRKGHASNAEWKNEMQNDFVHIGFDYSFWSFLQYFNMGNNRAMACVLANSTE